MKRSEIPSVTVFRMVTYGNIVLVWVKRPSDRGIAFVSRKKVDVILWHVCLVGVNFLKLDAYRFRRISVYSA